MRTTNQPHSLSSAIEWIRNKDGIGRLYLLVQTDPASNHYMHSMKTGKPATLMQFEQENKSKHRYSEGWRIMSFHQAVKFMNDRIAPQADAPMDAPTFNDVPRETSSVVDTVEPDNYVPEPVHVPRETVQPQPVVLTDDIRAMIAAEVAKAVAAMSTPTTISIQPPADAPVIPMGTVHFKFPKLLQLCSARGGDGNRLNILLHGPAGTSKSTSAKQVAKALSLPFYPCSAISDEYKLFGFRDANGNVVRTAFREVWEHGGVFLFDELSGSDENAFLSFNGTLANGLAPFPDGAIERHPDCIIIAGDNVLGGATAEYNGRNKMDAASMDRFVTLEWPIDKALEQVITADDAWLSVVRKARDAVSRMGIRDVMITPRASLFGASLIRAGMTHYEAAESTIRKSMDDATWKRVCNEIGLSK